MVPRIRLILIVLIIITQEQKSFKSLKWTVSKWNVDFYGMFCLTKPMSLFLDPKCIWSHLTTLSQRSALPYETKIWRRNDLKFAYWMVFKRDIWLAFIVLSCVFSVQICYGWLLMMIIVMQLPGKNRGFWNVKSWLFFVLTKMKNKLKVCMNSW